MRKGIIVALALAACGKRPVPPPQVDASPLVSASPPSGFVCGAKPICPAGAPADARALVDAVNAESAPDRAAALVACLGDKVRVDTDPGFSDIVPSQDSQYLLGRVDHDDVMRVFDATTWTETMRLDDALTAFAASGARAVVNHRAGGATLWDLAAKTPAITIPSTAGVSAEGTAVFWLESTPRRALAIAGSAKEVVRIPIDVAKEPLTLAELPGGQFLASTSSGRHWVVDPGAGSVVRSFRVPESRPFRVAGGAVLLDVGVCVDGSDMAFFMPSHAPYVTSIRGSAPPRALTGPGCTASVLVAASDDGQHAVTRTDTGWCLFDVPTQKLLGTVKDASSIDAFGSLFFAVRGQFVGPNVVVASIGETAARLRVMPGRPDPLYDLAPLDGTLLLPTSEGSIRHPISRLSPAPVSRAWVGAYKSSAPPERVLQQVQPDGTIARSTPDIDFLNDIGLHGHVDPRGGHLIGSKGIESIRSCLLPGTSACVDFALGGHYEIAPDGTWVAGPAVLASMQSQAPAFSDRPGAVAVASVATGKSLLSQHTPGFQAATFTTETELALFGEDGALLTCSLTTRACRRVATNPKASAIVTERGQLVIADDAVVTSVPPLRTAPEAKLVVPEPPSRRMREQARLFHVRRGFIVDQRAAIVVQNTAGDTLRPLAFERWALMAASTSPARVATLSAKELAVFDLETGKNLFTRQREGDASVGAVAIDATGARVAFAEEKHVRVLDVASGQERGHWPIPQTGYPSIAISPDGTKLATEIEVTKTPKGHQPDYSDSAEHFLILMDLDAPTKIERVSLGPLRTRTDNGVADIAMTNGGFIVVTYKKGGVRLVDPSRKVFELARESTDDGVWLKSDAGVSSLGTLAPTSRGIACRVGAWMLPTAACLPTVCRD